MSSPAPTDTKTISSAGEARGSLVPTIFHDNPYMLVRQAYSPTSTDTESEPFKDPLKTGEPQPLSHSTARMDVRTQTSLSPSLSARVTEAMTLLSSLFHKRHRPSYETSSSSPLASSLTLPLQKRYQGTSEPIADTETKCKESEVKGTDSESEEAALEDQP
ncbi:hypothetical protein Tco_0827822 [Tanacetum coccineum]